MTKTLETLVEDIYGVLDDPAKGIPLNEERLGREFGAILKSRLDVDDGPPEPVDRTGVLRASNLGTPCERQLWYKVNAPDSGERLAPHTRFKFLYGHVLELVVLELAAKAGHNVSGQQTPLAVGEVAGHRDAVIDGIVVDVKSASSFSFDRFRDGLKPSDDKFGYLDQLKFYLKASKDAEDPEVTDYNTGAFLVVDKTHGHICLDVHTFSDEELDKVPEFVYNRLALVKQEDLPPRTFEDLPDGKSGNRKLGTECSYCDFKWRCWPGLKAYAYSGKPRFLTQVVKEPKVEPF